MRATLRALGLMLLIAWLWAASILPVFGREHGYPASAYVQGVVGHPQAYTLSCESRSAADWAFFWGVYISENEFLNSLPRSDNPNAGFVGDPNDAWGATPPASYGVHAQPVADLLQAYGLDAKAHYGLSWDMLRGEIADGRPVIVWVIGQMWNGNGFGYEASNGETVRVAPFEHSMIVVGYDENWVHAVDASTGLTQTYAVTAFLRSWEVLGNMAITGSKQASEESPPPEEPATENPSYGGNTYTVQRGDYLVELGRLFGINWLELASLNNIFYPYTLYPGQTLQVPGSENETEEPAPQAPTEQANEEMVLFEQAAAEQPHVQQAPETQALPEQIAESPIQPRLAASPPVSYAFLMLGEPHKIYFPILTQPYTYAETPTEEGVVAAGICLFTRKGTLYVKPASHFRGWCISADRIRPEYLMGLAGSIPELP